MVTIPAEQHLLECLAEDLVEDGIEDRIDHGAGVAEPRDQIEDFAIDTTLAIGTDRRHQVQDEERRPQDYEREEHHPKHLGRLLLEPDDPAVAGTIARDHTAVARMMTAYLAATRVPQEIR